MNLAPNTVQSNGTDAISLTILKVEPLPEGLGITVADKTFGEAEDAVGPAVLVLRDKYVPAVANRILGLTGCIAVSHILTWRFETDVHFAAYGRDGDPRRFKIEHLPALSGGIEMRLVVFDVDCSVSHRANGGNGTAVASDEWFEAEQKKFDALKRRYPGAFVYRTKGGYRIVYALPAVVTIRDVDDGWKWRLFYLRSVCFLAREFGIIADPACSDWTRLFRAPRATRDLGAGPEDRERVGNALDVGFWTYTPLPEELDEDVDTAANVAATVKQWRGSALGPLQRAQREASGFLRPPRTRRAPSTSPAIAPRGSPPGGPVTLPNDPITRRARLYAGRMPAAIAGQGGHLALFKVAVALAKGFALPRDVVLAILLCDYNPRCVPPWSVRELEHKVADAERNTTIEHGYLLSKSPKDTAAGAGTGPARKRPSIMIRADEHEVTTEAVGALATSDRIFQRGGLLVQVVRDQFRLRGATSVPEAPRIVALPDAGLREIMAETAEWEKLNSKEDIVRAHVPAWCVQEVLARCTWGGIRVLEGIVTSPVLLPDGSILERPGYDETSGLLFVPTGSYLPVPTHPSKAELSAAVTDFEEIFADFPFASQAHFSGAVAGTLSPIARYSFDGPAPLTAVDATAAASGKGLLTDTMAMIALGRHMARMPQALNEDEERKRITSIAIAGEPAVLIDNVVRALGSGALDAALTATTWSDRILGASRTVRLPLRTLWYATGNNLQVQGDTGRRMLIIRLEPLMEKPELREGFRYANLLGEVRRHRPRYLRAALTILRAYFAAGAPDLGLPAWGSFEGWSAVVRSAVVFAGLPDPAETRASSSERADAEANAIAQLVSGWKDLCSDPRFRKPGSATITGATAGEAVRFLQSQPHLHQGLRDALAELTRTPAGVLPTGIALGYVLRKIRGRVVGGHRLLQRPQKDRASWYVEPVTAAPIVGSFATRFRIEGGPSARDMPPAGNENPPPTNDYKDGGVAVGDASGAGDDKGDGGDGGNAGDLWDDSKYLSSYVPEPGLNHRDGS